MQFFFHSILLSCILCDIIPSLCKNSFILHSGVICFTDYRTESDSIGTRQVPADAYYGVQSLRGCENFRITGQKLQPEFIESLAQIKKACAICPKVGYKESADITKTAIRTGESVREVLKSNHILSDSELDQFLDPQTMV